MGVRDAGHRGIDVSRDPPFFCMTCKLQYSTLPMGSSRKSPGQQRVAVITYHWFPFKQSLRPASNRDRGSLGVTILPIRRSRGENVKPELMQLGNASQQTGWQHISQHFMAQRKYPTVFLKWRAAVGVACGCSVTRSFLC